MATNEGNITSKKYFFYILFFLFTSLSIVLIILPANFFDTGQSICISVLLFKKECYGCGMTRAIQHLIHLDFNSAYHYNKLSFIVFPLLIYLIIKDLIKLYYRNNKLIKKIENKQ